MKTDEEILKEVFDILEYDGATEYWDKQQISVALEKAIALTREDCEKENKILIDKVDKHWAEEYEDAQKNGQKAGEKIAEERILEIIPYIINNWYGIRRGKENTALNQFVQRHVIDTLIEELKKEVLKNEN